MIFPKKREPSAPKMVTDARVLVNDIDLALEAFAAEIESAPELLTRLGLSRQEALAAADMDEEVESCREDLRTAMMSAGWRIWGENTDEAQINRLYKIIRRHLPEFVEITLCARFAGHCVAEYVYKKEADGFLTLDKVINKSEETDQFYPRRDGTLLWHSPQGAVQVDTSLKFLSITSRATAHNPKGDPLVARLFPAIMLRRHGLKFAAQFIHRYAQPYIIGKSDTFDKEAFNRVLYGFLSGGAATVGAEESIDIQKLDADGSAFRLIEQLANARIQKLLLGRVKTSDLQHGARAAQETEEDTRIDRIDAYLNILGQSVQHALDALLEVNRLWGLPLAAPQGVWFEFQDEIKVDQARAERDQIYFAAGLRPTRAYYADVLGFEESHFTLEQTADAAQFADTAAVQLSAENNTFQAAHESALMQPKITAILAALEKAHSYEEFAALLAKADIGKDNGTLIRQLVLGDLRALADGAEGR